MKTLVLWLSVGLLLRLALSPAWGQPHHQEAVGAQGHERRDQPPAEAPDIPVDDLNRGTPRRAIVGFHQAVRARDYPRAARYLDLRNFPAEAAERLGPRLARHLKIVLDQQLPIDGDSMSDSPAGHLEDGLPPDVEHVGRIETPGLPVHIRLQRVPRPDGVLIWQLSAASVAAIPDLYARYGYGRLGEALPSVFLETEFLDTQLWQWLALVLLVGMGYALGQLATTLGLRLLRRRQRELSAVLSTFVARPVRLLILVLFLALSRRLLQFSVTVSRLLDVLEQIVLIVALAWMILRVVESGEALVRSRALRRGQTTLLPLLPVLRKSVKILIATFAGLAVLHSFGVNVIAVLAGLGVGGIAVALAAQHPEWQDKEPFASLLKGDVKGALAGGERAMLDIIMATHAWHDHRGVREDRAGVGCHRTAAQWQWGNAENALKEWALKAADVLSSWTSDTVKPS